MAELNLADTIRRFDSAFRSCVEVSLTHADIAAPTQRHYWASVLFTSICTRSASLLTVVPHSTLAYKEIENWDYAAVGMLVRSIFELRLTLYYLCVEDVSVDEWVCRLQLIHLHDCVSRQQLFDDLGDLDNVTGFGRQAEELRERLASNAFFTSLPERRQSQLLRGKTAFLNPLEGIAVASGTDLRTFRVLYRFLSVNAHGLPMAFHRVGNNRGRGVRTDTEEGYIDLWVQFAIDVLLEARNEYTNIWSELPLPLAQDERKV